MHNRSFKNITGFILLSMCLIGCDDNQVRQQAIDTQPKEQITLRIGDQKGNMQAQLEASDLLKGTNYKISWYEFPAAAPVAEALKVEGIDIGYLGDAPFLFANANGGNTKAIAVYKTDPYPTAILVPENSPIKTVSDLKSKRITTSQGSIGHLVSLRALESAGIKSQEVEFKFLSPADGKLAVTNGSVDAWAVWDPYTAFAELKDSYRIIADGRGLYSGYIFLAATSKALADKNKRQAIQDFIYRLKQSQLWTNSHANQFGQDYAKIVGLPSDVGILAFKRRNSSWEVIDQQVVQTSQDTANFYLKHQLINKQVDVAPWFDHTFRVIKD